MTYILLCDDNRLGFAKMAGAAFLRSVQILHSPVVFCTRQIRPFSGALVAANDEAAFRLGRGQAWTVTLVHALPNLLIFNGFFGAWTEIGVYACPVAFRLTSVPFPH